MVRFTGPRWTVGLATLILHVAAVPSRGQAGDQGTGPIAQGTRPIADDPWAEVLSATKDWVVLQNAEGQQFPVSVNAIRLFVARWPTTADRLAPGALLEATGMDNGSYRLVTNHVDVYEGSARNLVEPGLLYISGSGRIERPIDFTFNSDAYGEPFPGLGPPIQGGVNTGPQQLNVVGPIVSRNPLAIGVPGNNSIAISSPAGDISMTQITPGNFAFIRPGDLVYFLAVEARPKSLILNQFVLYKRIPLDQFAP